MRLSNRETAEPLTAVFNKKTRIAWYGTRYLPCHQSIARPSFSFISTRWMSLLLRVVLICRRELSKLDYPGGGKCYAANSPGNLESRFYRRKLHDSRILRPYSIERAGNRSILGLCALGHGCRAA